jgi:hypothetical protein
MKGKRLKSMFYTSLQSAVSVQMSKGVDPCTFPTKKLRYTLQEWNIDWLLLMELHIKVTTKLLLKIKCIWTFKLPVTEGRSTLSLSKFSQKTEIHLTNTQYANCTPLPSLHRSFRPYDLPPYSRQQEGNKTFTDRGDTEK